jgi:hypothetical protein
LEHRDLCLALNIVVGNFVKEKLFGQKKLLKQKIKETKQLLSPKAWQKISYYYQFELIFLECQVNLALRARWDDFRIAPWLDIIDYPEITLQQTQQLLTLVV